MSLRSRRRVLRYVRGIGVCAVAGLLAGIAPGSSAAAPPVVSDGAFLVFSPIADAAMRGDEAAVRVLIAKGADVNAAQGDGMTALHWAARTDNAEIASLLLEAGADADVQTRIGAYTPLHMASQVGSATVVVQLLEAGVNVAAPTESGGATALHFAAAAGNVEAVRALLEHGASVDVRETAWGQTPLIFAAESGRTAAVIELLEAGADPALTTRVVDIAALTRARQIERRERNRRVKEQAQAGATTGAQPGESPAAASQPTSGLPAPAASDSMSEAEREEYERPIEEPEPLTYGELVGNQGGMTALLHAAREGHTETVRALLAGGAGVDQVSDGDRTSPLLISLVNGHFDLALELIEHGANVRGGSDAGTTPLYAVLNTHWAPKSRYPQQHAYRQQDVGYLELMTVLLDAGADPNARLTKHLWFVSFNFDLLQVDTRGATPFWRAAYALDIEAMELLRARGADVTIATERVPERGFRSSRNEDEPDPSGLPPVPIGGPAVFPIHAASGVGYGHGFAANAHRHVPDGWLPAMRYLVEDVGVDIDQADHNGYTALHHAASRGDVDMIRYLAEHGADVTAVSRAGQTTADMANGPYQRIQPFPEAVVLLESLGAKNNQNCVSC